ncbi:sodium:solute symporter family protein [Piscinibacter sp. Jin2]|uniref:Sodium:solute symporter family protein n=1 Tax=Aquariibacter lacus TaxID=2801332 RepID=A0A9X0XBD2_9BURK|nr:sodium:solute symporter family protein [Piscinibacter lacus]MBL0719052.1 sodium:solute symporter family protein [Piscinibacter lacus]
MNTTLISAIALYLVLTLVVGLLAARRVHSAKDFALAGRSLPLYVVVATTFATWFGSELVLGVSAKFVEGGFNAVIEDPIGSSFCLILVGLFFARKLYKKTLLTIGDYYRQRFGPAVEGLCSLMILLSYLGWVAAQITALGLVFNLLSDGAIPVLAGMALGTTVVLVYTLFGGMWSVAVTDLVQMVVIVLGLIAIAFMAADLAGGADKVIAVAAERDLFRFLPEPSAHEWLFFIGAAVTLMFGSIPQQDVFQRVMAAKDADTAARGPVLGGLLYLLVGLVPMFTVTSALLVMPEEATALLADDPQKVLPALILNHMPLVAQVFFFGALLSAIMSTASATLLAPSTIFVENVLRHLRPAMDDATLLRTLRLTVVGFTVLVFAYAVFVEGTPIYDMVASAYQITLAGAFVPLVAGLFWKRASTQGALLSIVLGIGLWAVFTFVGDLGERFPAQLAGLGAGVLGMVIGSLAPQVLANRQDQPHDIV